MFYIENMNQWDFVNVFLIGIVMLCVMLLPKLIEWSEEEK